MRRLRTKRWAKANERNQVLQHFSFTAWVHLWSLEVLPCLGVCWTPILFACPNIDNTKKTLHFSFRSLVIQVIFLRSRRDSRDVRRSRKQESLFCFLFYSVLLKIAFDIIFFLLFLASRFFFFFVLFGEIERKKKKQIKKKRKEENNLSCVKWRSLIKLLNLVISFYGGGENKKISTGFFFDIQQKNFAN